MPYKKNSSRKFVAPLFLAEDRYWEDYMRPYLEKEGWCVVEVDCAGVQGTRDFGYRLMEAIRLDWENEISGEFDSYWAEELATEIDWLDMRQGLFVYLKHFEDVLKMSDYLGGDSYANYVVRLIDSMQLHYPMRPAGHEGYEVLFGYGLEVPKDFLPRVEEYFEGHEIICAGPDTEYPWSQQEERKKKYFPSGFPDPLYDKNGIWITDPNVYPESTSYTGDHEGESSSE